MITIENLTKSFGGQTLFNQISFKINQRERIGLVGRNGHGKTTLFRLMTGKESADSGSIIIPKHYRIGYVRQNLQFSMDTVLKEGMTGLSEQEHDHSWKVEKILSGLGFSSEDMRRHPNEFSGGYQVRLNLAKILVSEPDLLLLDEPTNYLDISSIRWIEHFLLNWHHELMLITHDRSFMDKLATHIIGIHRKKVRKIAGDTGKFYTQIAQDEEIYEKTRVNDEKRQKEIKLFISRFRAKARLANMVQSRIKTLSKTEKKDKLESIKTLDFSFRDKHFQGKYVLTSDNICFSYNSETPLIKNFSLAIAPRDRVCIVGKNGKGKTTLIKLIAEMTLKPQSGKIKYGAGVSKGFYEQTNVKSLVDTRTVEEEILYSHGDLTHQTARNICGAMMFEGNDALKKIAVLSGGEKSRVMLGKLLAKPVNLLFLDEPTNHLDMESCDAMLAALDNFNGAVVMVTHNEMFLHALAQRLIVFQDDKINVFEGTYQDFIDKEGWHDEKSESQFNKNTNKNKPCEIVNKKEIRRKRSEIIAKRSKILKPLKRDITKIENNIENCEQEFAKFEEKLLKASETQNGSEIAKISKSMHTCQLNIDGLFDQLEQLTDTENEQNALFEKQLEAMDAASL